MKAFGDGLMKKGAYLPAKRKAQSQDRIHEMFITPPFLRYHRAVPLSTWTALRREVPSLPKYR